MASDSREEGGGRRWTCCCSSGSYSPANSSSPPRDRGHLVYLCMLMGGAGFLFPWSSYITAVDYFFFLYWEDFRQVSVAIPMTYLLSTCFFTIVNVTIANRFPLHCRIGFGYLIFFLALLVVPLLDVAVHSCVLSTRAAYYLTILSVAMVGAGSGGTGGHLLSSFPHSFSHESSLLLFSLSSLSSAVQLLRSGRNASCTLPTGCHGRGECGWSHCLHQQNYHQILHKQ